MTVSPCPECGADTSGAQGNSLCPRCLIGQVIADSSDEATEITSVDACPRCGRPVRFGGGECIACAETRTGERTSPDSFTGPRRIGPYRILGELGSGGMGTVFEAQDDRMARRVALKVLSIRLDPASRAGKRFQQEAWIAGRMDHPNVVKVYERGQHDGYTYYSMEMLRGGSLHDVIANLKRWGRDDRWNLEFGTKRYIDWALTQVITAARALDYAHRQGIVHRDVKPMNLLLSREQATLKIADFGLALDAEASRMTGTGDVMGTAVYMAPEQILARRDEIDGRTDLFALGVTLFQLLTLELPYAGNTREGYMHSVLNTAARRARSLNQRVSRDLETVIGRALEKSPRDRYASTAAFADDLQRILNLQPIEARPPGAAERVWKWGRRKPIHAALAVTLGVGLPLTTILGYRAVQHRQLVRSQALERLQEAMVQLGQDERFAELIDVASETLQLDPGHTGALRSRAIASLNLATSEPAGRPELQEQAIADVRRITELRPDFSGGYRLQQYVLARLDLDDEAREAASMAERLRAKPPTDETLEFEGLVAMNEGDFETAIDRYSTAIARSGQRLNLREIRAEAWEKLGEIERAIDDFEVVVAVAPSRFYARHSLARLLKDVGRLDESGIHYLEAIEIEPDRSVGYGGLSSLAIERGSVADDPEAALEAFREAEQSARRAIELDPANAGAHTNLGVSLMEQNRRLAPDPERVREAMAHYDEADRIYAALGDTDARADLRLNQCDSMIQSGDYARGLAVCIESTHLAPKDPDAFYNLAALHALSGRPDEAIANLETDLTLGDDDWNCLESDPWFDSLRADPRYTRIVSRMRALAAAASD